ncbi:OmpA family protein [Thermocoleostomius sinensis]|uniref:OmpA family protein n=1 Tax=Thermocoleostomius sinensis A174 TaxID=2016057 RepID=A0A9E8Z912_9CYAN|nr:OmpA family protein [Thermocoleostomius sinensis]WAL58734.1 OmpA family protein [Thermocoleostomius sinensis A174]
MHYEVSMTQSSTPPTVPTQRPVKRPSPGRGRSVLTFIFRLLLLGVSGSIAGLLGIAVAQFYPGQIQEPPLVERLLRGSQAFWQSVTRLPDVWNQESGRPIAASDAVSPSPSLPAPPITTLPPLQLPEADRQQVQTELAQLQTDLQQLNNRTASLETRVGTPTTDASIEQRLQTIQQRLDPTAPPVAVSDAAPEAGLIPPSTSTIANGELLKVTLPSDALFTPENALRPETSAILDSIIADLQRYPNATIRVIGHTDSQGSTQGDRTRSFEQATAVTQYLSNQLGEGYQWVTVGYGSSLPLVENTSAINHQRNRRIEIIIDPS